MYYGDQKKAYMEGTAVLFSINFTVLISQVPQPNSSKTVPNFVTSAHYTVRPSLCLYLSNVPRFLCTHCFSTTAVLYRYTVRPLSAVNYSSFSIKTLPWYLCMQKTVWPAFYSSMTTFNSSCTTSINV